MVWYRARSAVRARLAVAIRVATGAIAGHARVARPRAALLAGGSAARARARCSLRSHKCGRCGCRTRARVADLSVMSARDYML